MAGEGRRFTTPPPGVRFFSLVPPGAPVLDVGCGYGRTLALLDRRGYRRLVGLDFSKPMLDRAAAALPAALVMAGAGALPFRDGALGAVLALGLFTCCPDPGAQRRAADEIFRVLRPGGILYACLFLLNRDRRNRERYRSRARPGTPQWGTFHLDGTLLRHHSMRHARRLFRRFEWLGHEVTTFDTMGGHRSRGLILLARRPPAPGAESR